MTENDMTLEGFLIGLRVLLDAERRMYLSMLLRKLKQQIILLKYRLRHLSKRYRSAANAGVRQSLALRIDVMEGMRSTFYELARAVADELSDLYWRTTGRLVLIAVDFDDEDNERPDEDQGDGYDAEIEIMASGRC